MDKTQGPLENVSFPYFFIDHNLRILTSSLISAEGEFTEFLATEDISRFNNLLNKKESGIFKLKIGNSILPYRIHLEKSDAAHYHLFCFPLSSEDEELRKMAEHMQKRLHRVNYQLREKKKHLNKAVKENKETVLISDYSADAGQLAGIAHEIRNPLTTVKGFLQLLKPYLLEIGKEQYAEIAIEEINRANDIIYEFLNASKPPQNKRTEIEVNRLVKEMKIFFESEAHIRNINLSVCLCPNNPIFYGDVKQIKQVLINIIRNAMEACESIPAPEGKIDLKAKALNQKVSITIQDNGLGMSEKTISKLFVPFYTTKEKGTGIGLSICQKIIEEHDGKINVHSKMSQGTIFEIELPLISN
ncbi:sensor histidine kinase [Cytobacillus oceanisediminis]|uniref:sensor histidine kinase n=1 Tax=Cytobacillus oceanisediminis TaxID=665099 RepID=UPI001C20FF99|nr:ATP-binding protein [Cytobacillus oceanisediminis]MBU8771818.1 GHKL domain-containing protein [Cytobacillus oceanisediminis]